MNTTRRNLSPANTKIVLAAARALYGAELPPDATAVLAKHSRSMKNRWWYGVQVLHADGTVFTQSGFDDTYSMGIDRNDHTIAAAVQTFAETMECNVDANARAAAKSA